MKKSTKVKIFSIIGFLVLFLLLMVFLLSEENIEIIKSVFSDDVSSDQVHDILLGLGMRGYATVSILAMLQVVLTFLPAEPVQVVAGLAFGFPVGLLLCTIGVVLGNTIIYLLYLIYGDKLNQYFDRKLHFDLGRFAKSKRITLTIFILYFLPAIPYGMICLFAATMRMKYPRYIIVTTLGAIPSVCIGVGLGHIAVSTSWILSVAIFVVLLLVLVIVFKKKDAFFEKLDKIMMRERESYSSKTTVRSYKSIKLLIPYVVSRIVFFLKGVKVKYVSRVGKVGKIEAPAIVLCNHGAFVDFAYAGTLLRKNSPNFPVARLYFYKKSFGNLLRSFGCFPKSMFALDLESVKNCTRVIKNGGVLAMMPEARLSTVGEFEDIQEGTYSFIKKMGVPVYKIKISGDYLAKPKWAHKMR